MESRAASLFRKRLQGQQLPSFFQLVRAQLGSEELPAFVCIGTDRSTGDALGPLVGSMLEEAGYPDVIGTLSKPCDASNIMERLGELPAGAVVIAIDACLGQPSSVGLYQVSNGPIEPGKSVGKQLPSVGDYSLAAIVNVDAGRKYAILQSTSLYKVILMAREIAAAVKHTFPINGS